MSKKLPWGTRFAYYFYNNPEFFEKDDADFDRDARALAEDGINVVILFSMTHFRWSFYPYWERIGGVLRRICTSFHKYGIRVVEHHSTSLCECPLPLEDWNDREGGIFRERGLYFTSDKQRYEPYLDRWAKIKPFLCDPDATVEGVPFISMIQVDGRTGERSVSSYQTSVMCYNNADFRRIYFTYLESLCKCGIDGIMTDDLQFFSDGNACACPTCRCLFQKQTGYELPPPDKWCEDFADNYDNPAFIAFQKFKLNSTERFQRDVNAHLQSLGYDMLRIDYCCSSELSSSNKTSYPFSRCASLWDIIFQENTRFNVTKLSWPSYYCVAAYSYAIGEAYEIPSMSVFYDSQSYSIYFGWAMSIAWGQIFNGSFPYTPETIRISRFLRAFERRYPNIVYEQKKRADAGVFYSDDMRDIWHEASQRTIHAIPVWLQSGMFSGLCMSLVTQESVNMQLLSKNRLLIIPNILMLKDSELQAFGAYARAGGRLILCGQCGTYNENVRSRSPEHIKELLGSDVCMKALPEPVSVSLLGMDPMPFDTIYEGGEICGTSKAGAVYVREAVGAGEIIYIGVAAYQIPYHKTARGNRPSAISASQDVLQLEHPNLAPYYAADKLHATLGRFLHNVIPEPLIRLDISGQYLTTFYDSADGTHGILHLVNIENTLQPEGTPYGFETVIDNFDIFGEHGGHPVKNYTLRFDIEYGRKPSTVRLLTPERSEPVVLPFSYDRRLHLSVPSDSFSGYAVIEIC